MVNNQEIIESVKDINLSEKSKQAIDDFINSFNKTKEKFEILVNILRQEGFNDYDIDLILKESLKKKLPKSTLYDYRTEFLNLEHKPKSPNSDQIEGKNVIEDSSNDKDNSDNNQEEIVNLTVAGLQKKVKEQNQTIETLKKELDSKPKPNPSFEEFRQEKQISKVEDEQPINQIINYSLTIYFAGKDASVVIVSEAPIKKIIPANNYIHYDLKKL